MPWKRAQHMKPNKSQSADWNAACWNREKEWRGEREREKLEKEEWRRKDESLVDFNSVISITVLTNAHTVVSITYDSYADMVLIATNESG